MIASHITNDRHRAIAGAGVAIAARVLRCVIGTALFCAVLGSASGCGVLGALAYKATSNPTVPAQYKPKDEAMIVVVLRSENPADARMDAEHICRLVTDDMRANHVAPLIDPSEAPSFASPPRAGSVWSSARQPQTAPVFTPASIAEIGVAVGAKQVLYVDMKSLSFESARASEMGLAKASAEVRVIDARTGATRWPNDTTQGFVIRVSTPYSEMNTQRNESTMHDTVCRKMADQISHLFYDWKSEQMDSDSPLDSGTFGR